MKNKKNIGALCYITAICAMLALPTVTLPLTLSQDTADSENRVLAAFPSLKTEDGAVNTAFFTELTNWYGEHFGLRSAMITGYGTLTRTLLNTSAEQDVICGKDDWLFYAETLSDTIGEATLDETAVSHIAQTLSMMNDYAKSKDAALIFTAAPNKASIYPEYLPDRYLPRESENNLDLLHQALSETDVTVCDLRGILQQQAANDPAQLYHKLDSHWNGYGAMTAFSALMQTAAHSDYGFPAASCSAVRDFDGDLWQMLSPSIENKDWNFVYDVPQTYTYLGRFRSIDDLTIQSVSATGEGSLLMFRDSFGRALIPLLSEVYANATYTRDAHVPLYLLETAPADTVIYEIVERNLGNLLQYAPKMPAPQTNVPAIQSAESAAPMRLAYRTDGAYLHCYGSYDAAYAQHDDLMLTVTLPDGGGTECYLAFPCYEAELLGEDTVQTNGFSLYLPADALSEGASLSLIAVKDQTAYCMGTAEYTAAADSAN